jgi:leucine dehydrogenase
MDSRRTEHEQVLFRQDRESGLRAIIAIHDTRLGPAAGGCRLWPYASEVEALHDALRLSRGMTYKNALADIPFGGGKSVILGEAARRPGEVALERFGGWIEELGGRYVTAEDVGMRVADMRVIARRTRYVSGLGRNGIGGDPSPATAEGVLRGIETAVRIRLGRDSLAGTRVAVQGLGSVGFDLCRRLDQAGATLVVTDIATEVVDRAVTAFGAKPVAVTDILEQDVDVFAPCALGGVLTTESVRRLRARVVAGSANNQLAEAPVAALLRDRGVLYAPDYVINAGGVISVAGEYLGAGEDWVRSRMDAIPGRLQRIFAEAESSGRTTDEVAEHLALQVIESGTAPDATALTAV